MKHKQILLLTAGMLTFLFLTGCASGPAESIQVSRLPRFAIPILTDKRVEPEEAASLQVQTGQAEEPEASLEPTPQVQDEASAPGTTQAPTPQGPDAQSMEAERPEPTEGPDTAPVPAAEPEPAPEPEPEPVSVPEPESEPEPSVDIGHYVAYAQSTAQSLGLSLDSAAAACWDTPVVIGPGSASAEQSIRDLLSWYSSNGYTSVCVWSEHRADGTYNLYIGYA